jgi:predicted restriction endonuclease
MAIFLAPRSGEQSSDNFKKTIEGGYKKSDVESLLTDIDQKNLEEQEILYVWGNRPGGKGPWENMKPGDYVFFYQKGFITYIGELLYKTHNKALADALWGADKESGQSWEYVYFITNIIRVEIDYNLLKKYADYSPKHVVQGFQSYKEEGSQAIIENFGSIETFIENFKAGPTPYEITLLDRIASKTDSKTTTEDLEKLDAITSKEELESIINQLLERNKDSAPQVVESKVKKIKRDLMAVRKLKDIYKDECQICGFVIEKADGGRYSEVAHIKGLSDKGQDNIMNMLVLCPNHHKMLDFGKMSISLDNKEAIIGKKVIKLNNKHL